MNSKKITAGIIALAVTASGMSFPVAAYNNVPDTDNSFLDEIRLISYDPERQLFCDENGDPVVPLDHHPEYEELYSSSDGIPEAYDSRTVIGTDNFPEIKNQASTGTCWAHAALAAVEINGILKGVPDPRNCNFSEAHLAYFSAVSDKDPNSRFVLDTNNTSSGISYFGSSNSSSFYDLYNFPITQTNADGTKETAYIKSNVFLSARTAADEDIVDEIDSPTGLKAISGGGQALLYWDPVDGAEKYTVYCFFENEWKAVGSVDTPYRMMNSLTPDAEYQFAVTATIDGTESSLSDSIFVTSSYGEQVYKIPAGLTAKAENGKVDLTWDALDGVTEYKVYYSTTPNRYIDANFYSSVKSNSCTVTGLTNGTTYYFRVSAVVNDLDSSRFSPLSPNSPLLTPTLQLNQATVVPS